MANDETRSGGQGDHNGQPEVTGAKQKRKKDSGVLVANRTNRRFDLHAGRDVYSFDAHEKKRLPRSVIATAGFRQAQRYLTILEE